MSVFLYALRGDTRPGYISGGGGLPFRTPHYQPSIKSLNKPQPPNKKAPTKPETHGVVVGAMDVLQESVHRVGCEGFVAICCYRCRILTVTCSV